MDLFVVNHYAVADLHDPGYFTNRSESSSDEHVTEDGVPESKSFVVNFRKETSVSTLDHEWKTKKFHPLLILFCFLRLSIVHFKIYFHHPTEIEDACHAHQCVEFHNDMIFVFYIFDGVRHFAKRF